MSESPEPPEPEAKPDYCPRDGEVITITRPKPDSETAATIPPDPDALDEWMCPNGHFGYLLPETHLQRHPYDDRIQVCGRKQSIVPLAVSIVA